MSKKKVEKVEVSEKGEVIEHVKTFRVLKAFVLESGKRYEPQGEKARTVKVYELTDLTETEKENLLLMDAIEIMPADVPELEPDEEVL